MKWEYVHATTLPLQSPSMRREWIEIPLAPGFGGVVPRLPPCGGSGLKCTMSSIRSRIPKSPSMRREWIEMTSPLAQLPLQAVSLHAEGVD